MGFDNGIDITDLYNIEFGSGVHFSSPPKLFIDDYVDLGQPEISMSSGSYVSSTAKVFSQNSVDITDYSPILMCDYYTKNLSQIESTKVIVDKYYLIEVYVRPVYEGDDAVEIIVGRNEDVFIPRPEDSDDRMSFSGLVFIEANPTETFLLSTGYESVYNVAVLREFFKNNLFEDTINIYE